MNGEKWFVFYVLGSTLKGNRNAGIGEFDTEEAARDEMADIAETHPEYSVILIHGTEIERRHSK